MTGLTSARLKDAGKLEFGGYGGDGTVNPSILPSKIGGETLLTKA